MPHMFEISKTINVQSTQGNIELIIGTFTHPPYLAPYHVFKDPKKLAKLLQNTGIYYYKMIITLTQRK